MKPKIARFARASTFACPLCKEALKFQDHSLVCTNRHSFDIAKYGYVNLAPQIRQSKDYDKDNFIQRQIILEAGLTGRMMSSFSLRLDLAHRAAEHQFAPLTTTIPVYTTCTTGCIS